MKHGLFLLVIIVASCHIETILHGGDDYQWFTMQTCVPHVSYYYILSVHVLCIYFYSVYVYYCESLSNESLCETAAKSMCRSSEDSVLGKHNTRGRTFFVQRIYDHTNDQIELLQVPSSH